MTVNELTAVFDEAHALFVTAQRDYHTDLDKFLVAESKAMLEADGKNAEQRKAQCILATQDQRAMLSASEARYEAAKHRVHFLTNLARGIGA